uniref:YEATS domain-containing protein 2 n=1 Tax=Biomphalaria glabrata TaxID=6526 RepID=A0A2C9M171_BIOGL
MSGLKRGHEAVDPDYADIGNEQTKRQRALEEDAKLAVCQRIQNIVRNEFVKEISNKESELQQVDKRLSEARLMMDRLRACIVATYYGQSNSATSTQTNSANAPPSSIHNAVKKYLGKTPSHQHSSTSHVELQYMPEKCQEGKTQFTPVGNEVKTCNTSSIPSQLSSSLQTNAAPKSVPPDTMIYDDRRSRFKIKKKIIVGNVSKYIPVDHREANDMSSHKWMVYVRGPRATPDISGFVKKVWFFLHHSYKPNDLVEISSPPFHLTRRGWGEFPVRVQLHFVDPRNKKVDIIHHLKLDKTFTGLQTPGAETVIEVELEKDFFEPSDSSAVIKYNTPSDSSAMISTTQSSFSSTFSTKQETHSEQSLEKLVHSDHNTADSEDNADCVNHHVKMEESTSPGKCVQPETNNGESDKRSISVNEEYNVTIAHDDIEENIVDVTEVEQPATSVSTSRIKKPFLNIDQGKSSHRSATLTTNHVNIKTDPGLDSSGSDASVVNKEHFVTVATAPVSTSVSTPVSHQQLVETASIQVSTPNIFLVPSSAGTDCTSNIHILGASSLLAMQQKDSNLSSTQKLIVLNSQVIPKQEPTPVIVRHSSNIPQTSVVRSVAPKQVSLLTGLVVQPSSPQISTSLLAQRPKLSNSVNPRPQMSTSFLVQRPKLSNSVNPRPQNSTSLLQTPQLLNATNRLPQNSALFSPQGQLLINSSNQPSQISTSLLPPRPKLFNSSNQTFVLNKATNQIVVVNNSVPQIVQPANQSAELKNPVIYPMAVKLINPTLPIQRSTKQISLLTTIGSSQKNQGTASNASVTPNQQVILTSLEPVIPSVKMSAIGITKHGSQRASGIKQEHKLLTEEERKKGQYEILKAWKENPELYERNSIKSKKIILASKDRLEGEAEIIPNLVIEDYTSMSALLKEAVKLHPLIQEHVNKLTHPYCAQSLEQWLSWPVGKQRACEWHRACFINKYLKKCLNNQTEFKGEQLKTTRNLVKWCRLHAFSPIAHFNSSTNLVQQAHNNIEAELIAGDFESICSSFTPLSDFNKELSTFKVNGDTHDIELDIITIEQKSSKCRIKKEVEDADISGAALQYLPPSEGAEFVYDELRKRGLKLETTELEPGIYSCIVMDMLYKAMVEFASDIIREASSVLSQTKRTSDPVLSRQIVHLTLTQLPEAGFCCDKFLGKEDNIECGIR